MNTPTTASEPAGQPLTPPVLLVDAGGTGTRARWSGAAETTGTPGVPHAATAEPEAVAGVIAAAVEQLPGSTAGADLVAGVRGLYDAPSAAAAVAAALRARLGVAAVRLAGDVVAAHAGALAGRPGVVVAAGTGSVALGVTPEGVARRVDGWGPLIGDAGSGYWIGRAALDAALRAQDGRRGGSRPLAERARARYGPLEGIAAAVLAAEAPARLIAAFAADAAAAARDGDAVAEAIWERAAGELADTVVAAAREWPPGRGPIPVSWTGGLFAVDDLLGEPFRERLVAVLPDAEPVAAAGDNVDGADRLARGSPVHTSLVWHDAGG